MYGFLISIDGSQAEYCGPNVGSLFGSWFVIQTRVAEADFSMVGVTKSVSSERYSWHVDRSPSCWDRTDKLGMVDDGSRTVASIGSRSEEAGEERISYSNPMLSPPGCDAGSKTGPRTIVESGNLGVCGISEPSHEMTMIQSYGLGAAPAMVGRLGSPGAFRCGSSWMLFGIRRWHVPVNGDLAGPKIRSADRRLLRAGWWL
ncbi:hypothetical protein LZ30DRAFT_421086 [Colletotrichum cereale]|nr:hypothetical protein LZ30DRAFT_421086 [Colletotrichum cereale]